jgi:hypothetical protein
MTNTPILKTRMGLTNVWDGVSDDCHYFFGFLFQGIVCRYEMRKLRSPSSITLKGWGHDLSLIFGCVGGTLHL